MPSQDANTSRTAATPQQSQSSQANQSQLQGRSDQDRDRPLGSNASASSDLAAYFASQPQSSSVPYQQQQRPVFGVDYRIAGQPAWPPVTILPSMREAAPKDPMIGGFVKAMDKLATGEK